MFTHALKNRCRKSIDFSSCVVLLADEAARRRLDSMHQRLRLLEQQMETLEAEVGKASSASTMGTCA